MRGYIGTVHVEQSALGKTRFLGTYAGTGCLETKRLFSFAISQRSENERWEHRKQKVFAEKMLVSTPRGIVFRKSWGFLESRSLGVPFPLENQ